MDRRFFIVGAGALLLGGCFGEPQTGPVEIRYGREVGEFCKMIISDPRYATEIRRAKGEKVYKFDDIGDAIHWLKLEKWGNTDQIEFWVRDVDTGKKWLDARKAYYLGDLHSPMEYGFGAIEQKRQGAISFAEMRAKVIAKGATSRCDTPDHPNAPLKDNKEKS